MDKLTQSYRLSQIAKCKNNWDYMPSIKLTGGYEGSTLNMAISKEEWIKICQILTEGL
jgi:hypothetical protein